MKPDDTISKLLDSLKPPKYIMDVLESHQQWQKQMDAFKPPKHITDLLAASQQWQKQMDSIRPLTHIADLLASNQQWQERMDLLQSHKGLIAAIEAQNKFGIQYDQIIASADRFAIPELHPAISLAYFPEEIAHRMSATEVKVNEEQSGSLLAVHYDLLHLKNLNEKVKEKVTPKIIRTGVITLRQIIADIQRDNEKMFTVHPRKFEEIIGELFSSKGYTVELTAQTRDGGRDLIALRSDNGMPLKYLVECKRNRKDRPVGVSIVRSFCDVISQEGANKGIICTTSTFSTDAKKRQAKSPYLLELKDHKDLILWVNDYILNF